MKLQKKTSLGQKLGYQQCNHVERRNPGSEKYQSVLLEIGGKSWKQWVRNEEIGDNRKMKPWQFHFGQKVCSWYPGQSHLHNGTQMENQKKHKNTDGITMKESNAEMRRAGGQFWNPRIIFVVSTLPLSGQQWQWFVAPLLHFWENPAIHPSLSATPVLPDISSENIFTKTVIFLAENLPNYSSGENWSKRWFPLRIIRRWVIFIWKEKAEEPISRGIKANKKWPEQKPPSNYLENWNFSEEELDTKKCQQKLSGHDSWEEEYASSWKRNVISWGGGWIRKVAFPLQKLRITGSSTQPQQLERKKLASAPI